MPKYDWKHFEYRNLPRDGIDRYSLDFIPRDSIVLELGCATGFHSKYLTEEKGCRVIGVELDKQAAMRAKKYTHEIVVGNVEEDAVWKTIKKFAPYDIVYASNILEHLHDPEKVLSRCYQVVKPQGLCVIALPNVAFWRSRLRLLQGIWEYEDYGIFDRTHCKFFSLFSARNMIIAAGFTIEDEKYDPAGGAKWLTPLLKLFPNAYAHQVAFKARKKL